MTEPRFCAGCVLEPVSAGPCRACHWEDAGNQHVPSHLSRHTVLHGRYYVGRVLGQGGFGVTYLARDLKLQRPVAIKEYLPVMLCSRLGDGVSVYTYKGADNEEHFRKGLLDFLEEARTLALFDHPCIVPIVDTFEANGTAYMVMAYQDGVTLKTYLTRKGGKLPWAQAVQILLPVMDALRAVHQRGLLHRDVSPDNVMVTSQGQIRLLDFGAARFSTGEQSQSLSMILKHGYAPPEQYMGRSRQGPWTDVYAVAATLWNCIFGTKPPRADDRQDQDDLPSVPFPPDVPENVRAILLHALSLNPNERIRSIADLQQAFVRVLHPGQHVDENSMRYEGGAVVEPPPGEMPPRAPRFADTKPLNFLVEAPPPPPEELPPPPPKPKTAWIIGGVAAAVVFLVIVLIAVYAGSHSSPHPIDNANGASGSTGNADSNSNQSNTFTNPLTQLSPPPDNSSGGSGSNDGSGSSGESTTTTQGGDIATQEENDPYWQDLDKVIDKDTEKIQGQKFHIFVRNSADKSLRIAIHFRDETEKWGTIGWRTVDPGKVLDTHIVTPNRYVYAYAESKDGASVWNGSKSKDAIYASVLSNSHFLIVDKKVSSPDGAASNERSVQFFSVYISSNQQSVIIPLS